MRLKLERSNRAAKRSGGASVGRVVIYQATGAMVASPAGWTPTFRRMTTGPQKTTATLMVMSLTVQVPEELADRLTAEAARRGVTIDEVAAEAIEAGLPVRRRLSFSGMGRSGDSRGAAHVDELIAERFAHKTASDL
jgi:hypothetical protein